MAGQMLNINKILINIFVATVLIYQSSHRAVADNKELILIHISDTHEIMESTPSSVSISRFVTRVQQIREQNPNSEVRVIHSGDFLAPSTTSRTLLGQDIVQALAMAQTELTAVGNHEFDYGTSVLLERATQSSFPFLTANVQFGARYADTSSIQPYIIKEWAGKRIAFFGLTTEVVTMSSIHKFGDDVLVLDPATEGKRVVEHIRQNENVDYVVALSHLLIQEEDALIERLGEINGPSVDLILGGHEHRVLERTQIGIPHIKVRNDFQDIAIIRIKNGNITWEVENLSRELPADPAVETLLDGFRQQVAAVNNTPIAYISESFDGTWATIKAKYLTGELDLGRWVVSLFASEMGTEVGFMNLGVVSRSNRVYGPGVITLGDVEALFPFFTDPPMVIETTVATLKDKFERMIEGGRNDHANKGWTGKFPVVSGLIARWDLDKPMGQRLTLTDINGQAVSDDMILNITMNTYMYKSDPVLQQASRVLKSFDLEEDPDATYNVLKSAIIRLYGAALDDFNRCQNALMPE